MEQKIELDIFEAYEYIKNHREFKNLPKDAYLSFIYFSDNEFQIGFFLPQENKHRVFYVKPGKKDTDFLVTEEENQGKKPKRLDLDRIVITLEDVKSITHEIFKTNYPHDVAYKIFYILQTTDLGNVWNVTILTNKMELVNLKICAETGRLLKASSDKVFDLKL